MPDIVQSIIFDKKKFTTTTARNWLRKHGYRYGKVDEEINTLRFRQIPPNKKYKYRMKQIAPGIKFDLVFT